MIIDCCVRENENDKKSDNQIFDYRLTSLVSRNMYGILKLR